MSHPPSERVFVSPEALQELLRAAKGARPTVLEVGSGEGADFLEGHVPTAVYADAGDFERPPLWKRIPDSELFARLESLGLRCPARPIVLYGRNVRGTLAAARVAVLLLYAGAADVRLLDGGLAAWQSALLPLDSGTEPQPSPGVWEGSVMPGVFCGLEDVRKVVERPVTEAAEEAEAEGKRRDEAEDFIDDPLLVSIRNHDEQVGISTGYPYILTAGRIPRDTWGLAGCSTPQHMEEFLHSHSGRLLPLQEILAKWTRLRLSASRRLIFYCGTSWRASLAFMVARALGWPQLSVYDGGWLE
ncbi:MAG: rhodanese-like domain-containing protein, partial [archaeon]|nr:rhodanese-like domain-containing protein [archaeon]